MKYVCARCKKEINQRASPASIEAMKAIEIIKAHRAWRDAKLADSIQVDRSTLSRWKHGLIDSPDPEKLMRLLKERDACLAEKKR